MTGIADSDVADAARALDGVAVRTPLVWVEPLSAWLKLESRQPMGAFKIRGAYNAIRKLAPEVRARGVITFSSGNHGQAVAYAAQRFGVRAVVVMPETAPSVKVDGVKRWGGEVVMAGRTSEDRRIAALELAQREQLAVIPPFDDRQIIAGAGTVGLEIVEALDELSAVFVPVGGGGLLSGVAAAVKGTRPDVRVGGVEPIGSASMGQSRAAGEPVWLPSTASIADGLLTLRPGDLTFAHAQALVDDMVTVTEDDIRAAVRWLHREAGLVVEPSGAAATAAVLATGPATDGVVAIVSGGNVEADDFASYTR